MLVRSTENSPDTSTTSTELSSLDSESPKSSPWSSESGMAWPLPRRTTLRRSTGRERCLPTKTSTPQRPTEELRLLRSNLERLPEDRLKRTKLRSLVVSLKLLFSIRLLLRKEMTLISIKTLSSVMAAEDSTQSPPLQEQSRLLQLKSSLKVNISTSTKRGMRSWKRNIQDGNLSKFPSALNFSGKDRKISRRSESQEKVERESLMPSYYQDTDSSERIRSLILRKQRRFGDNSPLKPNNSGWERLNISRLESQSELTSWDSRPQLLQEAFRSWERDLPLASSIDYS